MGRRKTGRAISGWVNLDKPLELGSTPAVSIIRRLFDAKKAGHAGTLDPLATGILPIALGEATKTVSFMQEAAKRYRVEICFGTATNTDDLEGEVVATSAHRPATQEITDALAHFIGDIQQVPPKFSAIKKDGQRAYALARAGENVELAARQVHIDHIEMVARAGDDTVTLDVGCGKGVYIRALARDLAQFLGTQGHVASLRRTQVGVFDEKNAIGLEKLQLLGHSAPDLAALDACLLPLTTPLDDIPAVAVDDTEASRIKQGQAVSPQSLIAPSGTIIEPGQDVYVHCAHQPIAIARIDAGFVKPLRVFNL
jgi:tRNA pseudouridine55 synthase